jgi:predicted Zn-dependent protease
MKATNGWSADQRADRREAWIEAQRAMDAAPDDPIVLGQLGHLHTCLGRPDQALRLLERSIELDPNNAFSIGVSAFALTALGRADDAILAVQDVQRRSPRDPGAHWYLAMLAWAYLQLERFDECVKAARASIDLYNGWHAPWITLAAALAAGGEIDAAQSAAATGRRMAPDVPRFGFEGFFRYISRDKSQATRLVEHLQKAWTEPKSGDA